MHIVIDGARRHLIAMQTTIVGRQMRIAATVDERRGSKQLVVEMRRNLIAIKVAFVDNPIDIHITIDGTLTVVHKMTASM
mmetsp:Transcript_20947/g.57627  ORF Transcript_20947/g.57627 Transcript_20947/m.57627 type:complete len:80 (+) Transcript_20947:742-981(+)